MISGEGVREYFVHIRRIYMKNRLTKSRAIYSVNRALPIPEAKELDLLEIEEIASHLMNEVQRMYPHIQYVRNLLERFNSSDISILLDDEGNTLLHICAWHNHAEIIEMILEHPIGFNILDIMNENEETALCIALEQESTESAEILIRSGANLHIGTMPPLIAAIKSDMYDIAQLLINYECDIHAMETLKRTSLIWAIEKRMIQIALKLIEMGVSLDEVDFNGDTALTKSCKQPACESIISALLQAGANTRIPDRDGRLPGQIAQSWVRKRHPELNGNKQILQESYMNMLLAMRKEMEEIW